MKVSVWEFGDAMTERERREGIAARFRVSGNAVGLLAVVSSDDGFAAGK